jgi:hypothetical protein
MQLIQILLPVYNQQKVVFPAETFDRIRQELTEKFGGITTYSRAPATGLWKENRHKTVKDDILVYEVMADNLDKEWWQNYKSQLEATFEQDEILVRTWEVQVL